MKVAILGAGNLGLALAAVAGSRGHAACIWSRSLPPEQAGAYRRLVLTGKLEADTQARCEADLRRAIDGADVIVFAVPAYAQRSVIGQLAPLLAAGQIVVIAPAASASPLLLAQALAARNVDVVIAGLATTIVTAKQESATGVRITALRANIGLACTDAQHHERAEHACAALFGATFTRMQSPLALALAFMTPAVHAAMVLGNLSRVELGETWGQFECTTPSIARLVEALDAERMAIARSFSIEVPTLLDHCATSFGIRENSYYAFCRAIAAARGGGAAGPSSLDARYVTEDVPYGLVFFAALAKSRNLPVPLTDACITIMSTACACAFSDENDVLDALDMASLSAG